MHVKTEEAANFYCRNLVFLMRIVTVDMGKVLYGTYDLFAKKSVRRYCLLHSPTITQQQGLTPREAK